MLDVSSVSKGFLPPRMTTTQRTDIQSPANGLLVFDTDTKSYWYFSTSWKEISNASGGSFSLPYAGSGSIADKIFSIANADSSNGATAIYGKSGNSGIGVIPGINMGVWGDNSRGIGILGTSVNGVGAYGLSFQNHGVSGYSTNTSFAGIFGSHANAGPGVLGESGSGGIGVYGRVTGVSGKAGFFENTNNTGTDTVFKVVNNGTGISGYITNPNFNSTGALISGDHYGKGSGIFMKLWNAQNNNPGSYMYQYGNGDGLYVGSNKSKAAYFYSNGGNTDTTVNISHDGSGMGLNVELNNTLNPSTALNVLQKGVGNAANIQIINANNTDNGLNVITQGMGYAATFNIWNANSTSTGVVINNIGKGKAIDVQQTNNTSQNAINVVHNGSGSGVYANSLLGHAISGESHVSDMAAIVGKNDAGTAILGTSNSHYPYAAIYGNNSGTGIGVCGTTMTHGIGIMGLNNAGTTGIAGRFENVSPTGSQNVLEVTGNGFGPSLFVENTNSNSWPVPALALFKQNDDVVARINGTGKGFFNGGTQTGGADMAEAFDVSGKTKDYEPGDVLVISTDRDRTVEKSFGPYSTLVAGVYATKPGVLMTEEDIDTDISDKVPMGIVGVIPTKVCKEGGEIKRGNLLVTSSITGVAMKADIEKVKPGQVIGKALENYSGSGIGKIKVLVNVK